MDIFIYTRTIFYQLFGCLKSNFDPLRGCSLTIERKPQIQDLLYQHNYSKFIAQRLKFEWYTVFEKFSVSGRNSYISVEKTSIVNMSVILDSIKSHIETSQTVLKCQQSFINMLCFSHLKIHEDFNQNNETTLHQRNLLVLIAGKYIK